LSTVWTQWTLWTQWTVPPLSCTRIGSPRHPPSLKKMITCWEGVTAEVDRYLEKMLLQDVAANVVVNGKRLLVNKGTMLSRVIYH
jgi:hypothetical protein